MALSTASERAFENFNGLIRDFGKTSHHHPADYPRAVQMIMDLLLAGEKLHPDDVTHWYVDHGWSKTDARDLGEMADTIEIVLRKLGRI